MSFIKRAAEQAQQAAEAARVMAGDATRSANDPATQERLGKQAREAVGMARRGISTVVERIDPGTLAEAHHQGDRAPGDDEQRRCARRTRPTAISEISIAASIPPGDHVRHHPDRRSRTRSITGEGVSSAELVEAIAEGGEAVIALDGTTLDDAQGSTPPAPRSAAELPEDLDGPPEPARGRSARLDLLDRAGRALPGRPFRDLDAARRERSRETVRIQGMPSSSASVNLTPGDSSRSSQRISLRVAGGGREVVQPFCDLVDPRLLRAADRHEMGGVGRDLGRPDDALVVVVGLDDAGDVPPDADAVRAHDDGMGLAVLARGTSPRTRR